MSTTMGAGSNAWSSAVPATGGGVFGSIFALDEDTLFKAGGSGTIGISLNGGLTFSTLTIDGLSRTTRTVYATSTDSIWVGTNGGGLYYWNGDDWNNISHQLPGLLITEGDVTGHDLRDIFAINDHLWITAGDGSIWMATAIPEPGTLGLIGLAALVFAACRRRRGVPISA